MTEDSDVAQLVEQVTVNHRVTGSSPVIGARKIKGLERRLWPLFRWWIRIWIRLRNGVVVIVPTRNFALRDAGEALANTHGAAAHTTGSCPEPASAGCVDALLELVVAAHCGQG